MDGTGWPMGPLFIIKRPHTTRLHKLTNDVNFIIVVDGEIML